tara:strand:- start:8558 stop:9367 length:810 start_codon:yes stop_codon:yes gene_type:complete
MKALVDGDVLRYEVGYAAEVGWRETTKIEDGIPPWNYVEEVLYHRINNIVQAVGSTEPPVIYLSGKGNFRDDIAVTKVYKGNRKSVKPWHFDNISAFLRGQHECKTIDGLEADDVMAIDHIAAQERGEDTIICTRDKDLRQVPGWQYSWELGNQPSFGPEIIEVVGSIRLSDNHKKIIGTGLAFFYSQVLTGDVVDNIPGLPMCGPVKAYELLKDCKTEGNYKYVVVNAYLEHYDGNLDTLLEQGRLLWMVRELDKDGKPIMWEIGNYG